MQKDFAPLNQVLFSIRKLAVAVQQHRYFSKFLRQTRHRVSWISDVGINIFVNQRRD